MKQLVGCKKIFRTCNRAVHKVGKVVYQHRADILMVSGAVGLVVATADICNKKTKAEEILEQSKKKVEDIHQCKEKMDDLEYTKADIAKDYTIVYTQTIKGLGKIYWKDILLFSGSVICLVASRQCWKNQTIRLSKEVIGATAALAGYREKVKDVIGEEEERDLFYGIEKEKMETSETVDGKEVKSKKDIRVADESKFPKGTYAVIFNDDPDNPVYKGNMYSIITEIKAAEWWANDRAESRGFVLLNDILAYSGLNMSKRKEFDHIGIEFDPEHPDRINFGQLPDIYTMDDPCDPELLKKGILLTFEGFHDIFDLIPEEYD